MISLIRVRMITFWHEMAKSIVLGEISFLVRLKSHHVPAFWFQPPASALNRAIW